MIELSEDELYELESLIYFLQGPVGRSISLKYGDDSREAKKTDEYITFIRKVLSKIPGTIGDERCSVGGCSHCDVNCQDW